MLTKDELPACPIATTLMLSMRPIISSLFEWGTMYQSLVRGKNKE